MSDSPEPTAKELESFQAPPTLGNQFTADSLLNEYLQRKLPAELRQKFEALYTNLGELGGGDLYRAMLADRLNEPVLTGWDAWGKRIDQIEVSPLWKRAEQLCVEHGLVAEAYNESLGEFARTHQFVMNYLVQASLDVYSCPLAMTDGAARTLIATGNQKLMEQALPHLLSRDPATFWTSGQWMTERTGGSDVGASETLARQDAEGNWKLYGTKWFTSATTSQMCLTLGRPEGNGPGGRGLALFFVELRDQDGRLQNIEVNRLKDKLGTRKVPTAELRLNGTPAILVAEASNGVRNISPMLAITRTWNAVASAWAMRRAVALVRDYAGKRQAFGALLREKPLHQQTVGGLVAETEGAFCMAFRCVELLGRLESGVATAQEESLFRLLTPIAKLNTAKQAVATISEAIECFGGAGYVEDTGLPRLLADAQVLPIWEGTTNVLSLDLLRALRKDEAGGEALLAEIQRCLSGVQQPELQSAKEKAEAGLQAGMRWYQETKDPHELERGARELALTIGRSWQLALLCEHAQWVHDNAVSTSTRARASARRFAAEGVNCMRDTQAEDAQALMVG
jgi:alkylation response protein AidB-like acyl-CoA dehydrogenase